jgi:hypothetical protein
MDYEYESQALFVTVQPKYVTVVCDLRAFWKLTLWVAGGMIPRPV